MAGDRGNEGAVGGLGGVGGNVSSAMLARDEAREERLRWLDGRRRLELRSFGSNCETALFKVATKESRF
jgi:hypothetical protein